MAENGAKESIGAPTPLSQRPVPPILTGLWNRRSTRRRRETMKVGVIGSGVVAQTLGAGFLKHGHEVAMGTRDKAKLEEWSAKNSGAQVKSFAEAATFGDLAVLAVAGEAALDALKLAGADPIDGKPVIDACNPI